MKYFIGLYLVILGMHGMILVMFTMVLNLSIEEFILNLKVSLLTSLFLTILLFFPRSKN